eukprot:gene14705-biopygen591
MPGNFESGLHMRGESLVPSHICGLATVFWVPRDATVARPGHPFRKSTERARTVLGTVGQLGSPQRAAKYMPRGGERATPSKNS